MPQTGRRRAQKQNNDSPRHNLILVPLPRLKRLAPPAGAQAPFAAALEADAAQVVALGGGVGEEFFGDFGCVVGWLAE